MVTYLPRVLIAAPGSGQGKTTVATGLMAAFRRRGQRVLTGELATIADIAVTAVLVPPAVTVIGPVAAFAAASVVVVVVVANG